MEKHAQKTLLIKKLSWSLILVLLSLYSCGIIIPDSQNPVQVIYPKNYEANIFALRFSLPSSSPGLVYGQYIGVIFSSDLIDVLQFQNSTKFTCKLEDSNGTQYLLKPEISEPSISEKRIKGLVPVSTEGNIAFCHFLDKNHSVLKSGENIQYKLEIILTIPISTTYLRTIGMITCTSNKRDKIIIDSNPSVGTVVLYSNYLVDSAIPLQILDYTVNITSGVNKDKQSTVNPKSQEEQISYVTPILYPFTEFNIELTLRASTMINPEDSYILFEYPTDEVDPPTGKVWSKEYTVADRTEIALTGVSSLAKFSDGKLLLKEFTETLKANRHFKIISEGWKSKKKINNANKKLTVYVMYKNSYSIMSYSSCTVFELRKPSINATANHPYYWDVWRNAAWPIKFSFRISTDFQAADGAYVVIQHSNAKDGINKLSFIQSSCDFSENEPTMLDQSFGVRPNCFALRPNFFYPGATKLIPYSGSGFFFHMPGFKANVTYNVTIWYFADNCGGNTYFDPKLNSLNTHVAYQFTVSIYMDIDKTELHENRFDSSNLLCSVADIQMYGQCGNCKVTSSTKTPMYHERSFLQSFLTRRPSGEGGDNVLMREFTNWKIGSQKGKYSCDELNCYADNIAANSAQFAEKFLYTPDVSNRLESGSFLLLSVTFPINESIDFLANQYPMNYFYDTRAFLDQQTSGRLVLLLPFSYFQSTKDDKCYLSWGANLPNFSSQQTSLIKTEAVINNPLVNNPEKNFITYNKSYQSIEPLLTYVATDPTEAPQNNKKNRITSVLYYGTGSTDNKFEYLIDFNKVEGNQITVSYFSTCLTWANPLPAIKSIYSAIDIQVLWDYEDVTQVSRYTSKIVRFIKLYPEGGIFWDPIATTQYPNEFSNPTSYFHHTHLAYGTPTFNGVCLVEIEGPVLRQTKGSSSNTLGIWITFASLLETDYSSHAATYPVATLAPGLKAYGLQSGPPFTDENYYSYAWNVDQFKAIIQGVSNQSGSLTYENLNTDYRFLMGSVVLITGITSEISDITKVDGKDGHLLIPFYCPYGPTDSTTVTNPHFANEKVPTFMIAWMNMQSYTNIPSVDQHLSVFRTFTISTKEYSNQEIIMITNYQKSFSEDRLLVDSTKSMIATLKFSRYTDKQSDSILYVYNNNRVDTSLGVKTTMESALCTGTIILLNDKVEIVSRNELMLEGVGFTSFVGLTQITENIPYFYAFGKPFNRAILTGIGGVEPNLLSNNIPVTDLSQSKAQVLFKGIKRPDLGTLLLTSIEDFMDITYTFNTLNYLAFFCVSKYSANMNFLSNFVFNIDSEVNSNNYFFFDFNPDIETKWDAPLFGFDNLSSIVKNDQAANFQLAFKSPGNTILPPGSIINLSSDSFSSATLCGCLPSSDISDTGAIVIFTEPSSIATECATYTLEDGKNLIKCILPQKGNKFNIACYNFKLPDSTKNEMLRLTQLAVELPIQNVSSLVSYMTSIIFQAQNNYINNLLDSKDSQDISQLFGKISAIEYTHVTQNGGIGKAIITIALPRLPLRDTRITLTGDLRVMYLSGVFPRCTATFQKLTKVERQTGFDLGKNGWDNADALLDGCSIYKFGSSLENGLIITTKKLVYKFGLSFAEQSNIYVMLYPIKQIDFSKDPGILKRFYITITSNSNLSNVLSPRKEFNIPQLYEMDPLPQTEIWESLCKLNSYADTASTVQTPNPKIPGEVADYTFDFDLSWLQKNIPLSNVNELTVFFPFSYYLRVKSDINPLLCYYNNQLINCEWEDEGILNIKFLSRILGLTSNSVMSVTVTGITNPGTEDKLLYPCTINETDYKSGKRQNIVIGSGKIILLPKLGIRSEGIIIQAVSTTSGGLRFISYQVSNVQTLPAVSTTSPRSLATYVFRIRLDYAMGLTPMTFTLANPILLVQFPPIFNLGAFYTLRDIKITAEIDEYSIDANNNIIKSEVIQVSSIKVSGNRVELYIRSTTRDFSPSFSHWDVKINNIINPSDGNALGSKGLKYIYDIQIIVANASCTALYRVISNLKTYSPVLLPTPLDVYLTHRRGYLFDFVEPYKWILDFSMNVSYFNDPEKVDLLNIFSIYPGRYTKAYISLRQTDKILPHAVTTITLADNLFKMLKSEYVVSTSFKEIIEIAIGIPCGVPSGNYFLNFLSSDNGVFFTNVLPIKTIVNNLDLTENYGLISFKSASDTVPKGGSTFIFIYLSHVNFDELTLEWMPASICQNEKTAIVSTVKVPAGTDTSGFYNEKLAISPIRSVFMIMNPEVDGEQLFQPKYNPNVCYQWASGNKLSITVTRELPLLPATGLLPSSFLYSNSATDTDSFFPSNAQNAIRFKFTSPISNLYLYCALICYSASFVPDKQIIEESLAINKNKSNSQLVQYFSTVIPNGPSRGVADIIFLNLLRNQRYKLRCIGKTVQGKEILRNSTSVELLASEIPEKNQTIPFMSPPGLNILCIEYFFKSELTLENKKKIIEYCQQQYSQKGWFSNGCITCTDQSLLITSPGLQFPSISHCESGVSATTALRVLKERKAQNNNSTANSTNSTSTTSANNSTTSTNSNTTIVTSNMTNSTTTNHTTTTLPSVYKFTICPVNAELCSTNFHLESKQYADVFKEIYNEISTAEGLKKHCNISIEISELRITADNETPILKNITLFNIVANETGYVFWNSTYSTPLVCQWIIKKGILSEAGQKTIEKLKNDTENMYITDEEQVINKTKEIIESAKAIESYVPEFPTKEDIAKCTDLSRCGIIYVDVYSGWTNNYKVNNNLDMLSPFEEWMTYHIFYLCRNNVPYPQKYSEVTLVANFTIYPIVEVNSPPGTCIPGQGKNCLDVYISISISILLLLFILLII